jgi:hypothetical protein
MPRALPRVLALVVVAGATVIGLLLLSDATKYRGVRHEGGETRVVFSVDTKRYHHSPLDAARSLWSACVGSVGWEETTGPTAGARETFTATIRPGLGEDSRRRLRGCLEDAAVDRISGHVRSMPTTGGFSPGRSETRDPDRGRPGG